MSVAVAQSGHKGQESPTSIHVMPSEAQQYHPSGHAVTQLETRWCSASEHDGRQRGYGSAIIGRPPPPPEASLTVSQKMSGVPMTRSGFEFPAASQPTADVNTAVAAGFVTSDPGPQNPSGGGKGGGVCEQKTPQIEVSVRVCARM